MRSFKRTVLATVIAATGFAFAGEDPKNSAPADFPLPPGWTQADMQACIVAGTPGDMHKHLAADVGTWSGKTKMWMHPESQPIMGDVRSTVTALYDGRYVQCEMTGHMPGMPEFKGQGVYGYDNVEKKFKATWIDNMNTNVMFGTGELSSDKNTMTWTYAYTCPVSNKPTTMREVHTVTSPTTRKMEMFGVEPKSGKEYKIMEIELTKSS